MRKLVVISLLRWMWITSCRLLEAAGMMVLIFVLFLAGVIERSQEQDEQECDNEPR